MCVALGRRYKGLPTTTTDGAPLQGLEKASSLLILHVTNREMSPYFSFLGNTPGPGLSSGALLWVLGSVPGTLPSCPQHTLHLPHLPGKCHPPPRHAIWQCPRARGTEGTNRNPCPVVSLLHCRDTKGKGRREVSWWKALRTVGGPGHEGEGGVAAALASQQGLKSKSSRGTDRAGGAAGRQPLDACGRGQ